jgi:predicted extracellular nuclease
VRSGDSVIVTGTVTENFDVTQLANVQSGVVVAAAGQPVASPVVLPTGNFGPNSGNGSPLAEPYEGMLVRFNNVTVADVYPTFSDPTEFTVDGGTGPVIVRRDGTNTYTNVPADTAFGKKLLRAGDNISFVAGVMHYSFNRYKLTPRTNADYGTVTVSVEDRLAGVLPESFALDQNYPNPFNPSTTIAYGLPRSGFVTLKVYNILGQEVRTLVSGPQEAGRYTVRFDASTLATGLYLYRIHVAPESGAEFSVVKKMVLMK